LRAWHVQLTLAMKRFLLALALALTFTGCAAEGDAIDAFGGDPYPIFDTPPDTSSAACAACGAGTICVQLFNGTCGVQNVECKSIVTGCETATCSTACDNAYCDRQISTCSAAPCGAEIPGAFHCYGV
jgi:hypothetical protein